jgi:hypothetical protein
MIGALHAGAQAINASQKLVQAGCTEQRLFTTAHAVHPVYVIGWLYNVLQQPKTIRYMSWIETCPSTSQQPDSPLIMNGPLLVTRCNRTDLYGSWKPGKSKLRTLH